MPDPTRSFLAMLAEADVHPRLVGGRLVARLDHLPPAWADDCRAILRNHGAAVVAELRSRAGEAIDRPGSHDAFAAALGGAR